MEPERRMEPERGALNLAFLPNANQAVNHPMPSIPGRRALAAGRNANPSTSTKHTKGFDGENPSRPNQFVIFSVIYETLALKRRNMPT